MFVAACAHQPVLRVCADPNNLPFSNDRLEGFENRLADMAARTMGARVEYTWWAQRRGFLRNTLNANACDVVMGLPSATQMARTTVPYYRSSYVFISRHDRDFTLTSLDDRLLEQLRIGVQLVGEDGVNSPPAHALSRRGITRNVVGFSVLGDYASPNPPARIVRAVADQEVDVALAWGPMAGYFASRETVPLDIAPIAPHADGPFLPFVFEISMAVRKDDHALHRKLEAFIAREQAAIDALLDEYHIPRVGGQP
jgi:mxaJ protein